MRPVVGAAQADYRQWERGPSNARRVLGCLAIIVLTVVILLAGLAVFSSSVVRPYIGRQITERLGGSNDSANAPLPAVTAIVEVPTPPPGARQMVITQDQLNQQIAEHQDRLGPLDSASIQITPEEVEVTMKAYGLTGTYHGQVEVQNGTVAMTNGKIDGPLGWIVPTGTLESALNQQLSAAVNQTGASIDSVTLQQGQMAVAYSS